MVYLESPRWHFLAHGSGIHDTQYSTGCCRTSNSHIVWFLSRTSCSSVDGKLSKYLRDHIRSGVWTIFCGFYLRVLSRALQLFTSSLAPAMEGCPKTGGGNNDGKVKRTKFRDLAVSRRSQALIFGCLDDCFGCKPFFVTERLDKS